VFRGISNHFHRHKRVVSSLGIIPSETLANSDQLFFRSPGFSGLAFSGIGVGSMIVIIAEPLIRKWINSHKNDPETGSPPPEASTYTNGQKNNLIHVESHMNRIDLCIVSFPVLDIC
jgi:hypothetical protein